MNAIEFMKIMKGNKTIETRKLSAELSAEEYFDSEQGKEMMRYLKNNIYLYSNRLFRVDDIDLKKIHGNPLYKGRNFFSDMAEIGFSCEIISHHQEEAPIKTYEFKVV